MIAGASAPDAPGPARLPALAGAAVVALAILIARQLGGAGGGGGDLLIWLQWSPESIGRRCRIYLFRGLRAPLPEIWPELTHWN